MCHHTNLNPSVPCNDPIITPLWVRCPPRGLTLRLPYSLKVAHSSVVSAVLAAEELVPHTLLLSELITCHASHVTNVTKSIRCSHLAIVKVDPESEGHELGAQGGPAVHGAVGDGGGGGRVIGQRHPSATPPGSLNGHWHQTSLVTHLLPTPTVVMSPAGGACAP